MRSSPWPARSGWDKKVYVLIAGLEERFNALVARYPGNRCGDVLDNEPDRLPTEVCPSLIAGAIRAALELLAAEGISGVEGISAAEGGSAT